MKLIVTGGAGYIGSHAVVALLQAGYEIVVLDNLINGSLETLARVAHIAGRAPTFIQADVRDSIAMRKVFDQHRVDAVLHFAGLKSVGESVNDPMRYYDHNVTGTLTLCQAMAEAEVFQLLFSSSATVYGEQADMPITEVTPTARPTNPYGRAKLMVEELLADLAGSDVRWSIGVLRYFNPVGAHSSGLIGEDPKGIPNNLLPYIARVAAGTLEELAIFGNDYPTSDGTGVRDYIHVVDLVEGHIRALDALNARSGWQVWNLGTGQGYSVLEVVRAFEKASGRRVSCRITSRRAGDVARCWCDPTKAQRELGWVARRGLPEMMADAWRWQSRDLGNHAALLNLH